jgi:hypothetical protein
MKGEVFVSNDNIHFKTVYGKRGRGTKRIYINIGFAYNPNFLYSLIRER